MGTRQADYGQLIAFGFSFAICYGTGVGLGRHEADVRPRDHMPLKKAEYAFSVLYVFYRQSKAVASADGARILR